MYERKLGESTRRQDYVQKGFNFTWCAPAAALMLLLLMRLRACSAVRSEDGRVYAVGDEIREENEKEGRGASTRHCGVEA